jgi:hypothetical protein
VVGSGGGEVGDEEGRTGPEAAEVVGPQQGGDQVIGIGAAQQPDLPTPGGRIGREGHGPPAG